MQMIKINIAYNAWVKYIGVIVLTVGTYKDCR